MANAIASYTATRLGLFARLQEALSLYRRHAGDVSGSVAAYLKQMDEARTSIEAMLGQPLVGKRILEIGPGQQLRQSRFFAMDNQVVAIDLDEIATSASPLALLRTLKANGPIRFIKTLVRKLAGFDRLFLREAIRQCPRLRGTTPQVLRRDATDTALPAASFDCAMSISVFEHLPDPAAVFREIARLLRPGGVSHHLIHLYSSDSGAHDARTYTADRAGLPYWAHLRPNFRHLSRPNCYVNKLSLTNWQTLIERECPGAQITRFEAQSPLVEELARLRASGELLDYTDADLLTLCLKVEWKKPDAH
jgi:SAM-dependent methyltransferase